MLNLKYLVFVTFLVSFLANRGIDGLKATRRNSISSSSVNKRNILPPPHDQYWYDVNPKDGGTSQAKSWEPHKYGEPKYNADGSGYHVKDPYHGAPIPPVTSPKDEPKYVAPQPDPKYVAPAPKEQPKYAPVPKQENPGYTQGPPVTNPGYAHVEPSHRQFQPPKVDPQGRMPHYTPESPISDPYGLN